MKEPTYSLSTAAADPSKCPEIMGRRAELEHQIAAVELESKSIRERYLRAAADLENERKRRARDLEDVKRNAAREVVAEMIWVAEAMEHTFDDLTAEGGQELVSMIEGLHLVVRQIASALERLEVTTKEST